MAAVTIQNINLAHFTLTRSSAACWATDACLAAKSLAAGAWQSQRPPVATPGAWAAATGPHPSWQSFRGTTKKGNLDAVGGPKGWLGVGRPSKTHLNLSSLQNSFRIL